MLKFLGGGGATFIQGGTSIPESRVVQDKHQTRPHLQMSCIQYVVII